MPTTAQLEPNPFWNFSLALWESKQSQTIFLKIQDELNIDIVSLLFGLWCTKQSYVLNGQEDTIAAIRAQWHARLVVPIRRVRNKVGSHIEETHVRKKLLEAELLAEQLQHTALYKLSCNLKAYENKDDMLLFQNIVAATGKQMNEHILSDLRKILA